MSYDILFFEALGEENAHLSEEIEAAKKRGTLPQDLKYLVRTETLQEYLEDNKDAVLPDILSTKTHSKLPESWVNSGAPFSKSVITRSAGYDHFEAYTDILNVTSLREYCVNAVAETAIKLMFCACGNLNQYEENTKIFERNRCISFKELTGLKVTVFGVGKIGKRIYDMCKGLKMDTRAVDIRSSELAKEYGGEVKFITKDEAADSDIVICAMNYTSNPESRLYNKGYFTEEYLSKFRKGLVFINVTRGEIAPEEVIYNLYKNGTLFGVGLDVFGFEAGLNDVLKGVRAPENEREKAQKWFIDSALSRTANIYVQPHQAFNSDKAALCKAEETVKHLEAYYKNGKRKFDSQLPYYK